jgi:cobalt-zinc-cadmium efflux system outer membrane protein
MSRARQAHRLAAIGAATRTLWLPPLAAKERQLSGATLESDVALARQLSPDLSATALDADAAAYKIGAAGTTDLSVVFRSGA